MDKVIVRNWQLLVQIGTTAEERALPQKVLISLEVEISDWSLEKLSQLDLSVCYDTLTQMIAAYAQETSWILLEDLALCILKKIFETFPQSHGVQIEAYKFVIPNTEATGVRLYRKRL